MSDRTYARVVQALERLKLTHMVERLDQYAQTAATEGWTYVDFLDQLLCERPPTKSRQARQRMSLWDCASASAWYDAMASASDVVNVLCP